MPPAVLAPVEQALVAYLKTVVDQGTRVSTDVPSPRPASFVVLSRAGGPRVNLVQSRPTILVECWGSHSDSGAVADVDPWPLTKKTWEALARIDEVENLPLGLQVMDAGITEPVNYPDEATSSPRYTFIFTPTINLNTT